MSEPTIQRRIVKSRDTKWARNAAQWLSKRDITPNHVSIFSIVCSAGAFFAFLTMRSPSHNTSIFLPFLAIVCMQFRLICNLLDGMVAIEGGKVTASGEIFNDAPDRASDILIFVGAGYSVFFADWGISLGWFVAILAVLTAYVRILGTSIGVKADFRGPMAKQHRMAVLTTACGIAMIEHSFNHPNYSIFLALCVISIGCIITIYRRLKHIYITKEAQ